MLKMQKENIASNIQIKWSVNLRMLLISTEGLFMLLGREGMATICDILNMPQPIMSTKAWNDHSNVLYAAHKASVEEHLKSTRAIKLHHKLTKDMPNIKDEDVIDVAVTFDGTWSKRGHTANYMALVLSWPLSTASMFTWLLTEPNESLNSVVWSKHPGSINLKDQRQWKWQACLLCCSLTAVRRVVRR